MKTNENDVLMLLLKTGRKLTFSLPMNGMDEQEFVIKAMEAEGLLDEDVERAYFVKAPSYSPVAFQESFDLEKGRVNEITEVKKRKLDTIRRHRNLLLNKLDIQFLISLEDDCPDCTAHIKRIKKYLRDVPDFFLMEELNDTQKVINFNVFDNVFDIEVANPGSGYTAPPTITISPPQDEELPGFQMKAVAEIEEGKVTNIKTIRVGSSYTQAPLIQISSPEDEDGMLARAVASEPENNIYHYLEQGFKNTYNIYETYLKDPDKETE